ncbi:calcyclin-binding protein-like [Acipenser ruthenus]|uniref:calcyclin-binding protein-like n=1 Tax=Acipenser ruthenus TaxID=7906 RepID=UPI00145B637F|nr:calcyclin-binding protein-like [Acipenser ruthenus]
MGNIAQLQSDLDEVNVLLEKAVRKRVQDVLTAEKKMIEREIVRKQQQQQQHQLLKQKDSGDSEKTLLPSTSRGYAVKINNYGWDQSDKFVKIYITLNGVHKIPADNIQTNFTERSFEVLVKDLEGKHYQMNINNLLSTIDAQESFRKVKTDMVLVMCKKKTQQKLDFLTQVEKKMNDKKRPSSDADTDPNDGLMNILKKMYDEGNDEMKRTINKAWTESREKQNKVENMDF